VQCERCSNTTAHICLNNQNHSYKVCACAVALCSHQVKAKFIQRGVEIAAQLYSTDEGLVVDVSRLEVGILAMSVNCQLHAALSECVIESEHIIDQATISELLSQCSSTLLDMLLI
jgi:hypothetical protein